MNINKQHLKAGDWAGYGKELDAMKTALDKLAELTCRKVRAAHQFDNLAYYYYLYF